MAWVERPARDLLERAVGYVQYVAAEQMDGRDAIIFRLEEYGGRLLLSPVVTLTGGDASYAPSSNKYAIYLDVGTTVAMAQFQLLRDAMVHGYVVALYFLDDTDEAGREDPTGFRFAYEVMVVPATQADGVITAESFPW